MDIILKIVEHAVPVLLGGGITWLLSWRRAKRHYERKMAGEEYQQMDDVVASFTERITKQAMQNSEVLKLLMKIEEENAKVIRENRMLKDRLQQCNCFSHEKPGK